MTVRQRASLKTQITALLVATTVITLVLAAAVLSVLDSHAYDIEIKERLEVEANIIAANLQPTLVFDDSEAAHDILRGLSAATHVVEAVVSKSDGTPFARYPANDGSTLPNDVLVHSVPIAHDGEVFGALTLRSDRRQLYRGLYDRWWTTGAMVAAASVLMVVVARRLGTIVTSPMAQLTAVAREIARAQNYTLRARVDGPAEVGLFATVFNDMLREIEKREAALVTARDEIAASSRALADASRRAGMAQVAVGVMHNIGNVMTGIVLATTAIRSLFERMAALPLERVAAALDSGVEKGDFTTSANASAYLRHAARTQGDLVERINGELDRNDRLLEHVRHIIEQQQTLSSNDSNVFERIDLRDVIANAIEMCEHAGDAAAELELHIATEDLSLHTDRHKVIQILVNLLTNARQAVEAKSGNGKVIVSLERVDASTFAVDVTDEGTGIAPGDLSKIFQHGFTTKSNGHGFGLHASVNAAREMGGDLIASSDGPGRGATFRLILRDATGSLAHQGAA